MIGHLNTIGSDPLSRYSGFACPSHGRGRLVAASRLRLAISRPQLMGCWLWPAALGHVWSLPGCCQQRLAMAVYCRLRPIYNRLWLVTTRYVGCCWLWPATTYYSIRLMQAFMVRPMTECGCMLATVL